MAGWEIAAKKKRDEVNALIPPSWRLPAPLPPPEIQKDVTGKFIQQFLTAREIEITEVDAVAVLAMTTTGLWTAQEVAEAFCHRAALSHQMVISLLSTQDGFSLLTLSTGELPT
jgi:amidase